MLGFLECSPLDLIPASSEKSGGLDPLQDLPLLRRDWVAFGHGLSWETRLLARLVGTRNAGPFQGGWFLTLSAAWRFSEQVWKVVAESILPGFSCLEPGKRWWRLSRTRSPQNTA